MKTYASIADIGTPMASPSVHNIAGQTGNNFVSLLFP
jgi:hypothetical protein